MIDSTLVPGLNIIFYSESWSVRSLTKFKFLLLKSNSICYQDCFSTQFVELATNILISTTFQVFNKLQLLSIIYLNFKCDQKLIFLLSMFWRNKRKASRINWWQVSKWFVLSTTGEFIGIFTRRYEDIQHRTKDDSTRKEKEKNCSIKKNNHKSSPAFRITRTTGFPRMLNSNQLLLFVITCRERKEFIKIECYLQSKVRW